MKTIPELSNEPQAAAKGLTNPAFRLALAGPAKDSESWFGRPVLYLAE